jgi:hypothetical protein
MEDPLHESFQGVRRVSQTGTVTPSIRPSDAASRGVNWLDGSGAWLVLGTAMAIYALLGMWLTRGTTLFIDEQKLFITDHGFRPSALLAPLNGHLFLLERLMYAAGWRLFVPSAAFARIVEVVGVLLVVALFFVLAKRRVGAATALPFAVLVLFFGSTWENELVPSGIATVYCVAAGLGALLLLERRSDLPTTVVGGPRLNRADVSACALLTLSVASWTLGVAFAVGALVLIMLQPGSRRRVWVALVPLALYAAWLVWVRVSYVPAHGEVQQVTAVNLLTIPNFAADEASSVMGALAGLNYPFRSQGPIADIFGTTSEYGAVLAAVAVGALLLTLRRGHRSPVLWALIAILLVFWAALGLGYGLGRNPDTVRYAYEGGILVLLIAAEAASGVRLSRWALAALYLIVVLALGANVARLRQGVQFYRPLATSLRARLTALEVARDHVDPSFFLQSPPSFESVRAGPYLAAVDRLGSPAYSVPELQRQSESLRSDADSELVRALSIAVSPHPAGAPVTGCRSVAPSSGGPLSVAVTPPGITLSSSTAGAVGVRRFASLLTVPVGSVSSGSPVDLRIPVDRSRLPWYVSLNPVPSSLTVCQLAGGASASSSSAPAGNLAGTTAAEASTVAACLRRAGAAVTGPIPAGRGSAVYATARDGTQVGVVRAPNPKVFGHLQQVFSASGYHTKAVRDHSTAFAIYKGRLTRAGSALISKCFG